MESDVGDPPRAHRITLREMRDQDVPQVLEIERAVYSDPWTAREYQSELTKASSIYLVAIECREGGAPSVGVARGSAPATVGGVRRDRSRGLTARALHRTLDVVDPNRTVHRWIRRSRGVGLPAVVGCIGMKVRDESVHVVTVAVRPELEGQGLGQFMLIECLRLASVSDRPVVTLEVRVSNARARWLYERLGFEEIGLQSAYYDDGEDAVSMRSADLRDAGTQALLDALRDEHGRRFASTDWTAATMAPVVIERAA